MLSVVIGAFANIILDPIFIFTFKMGVHGAALATIISQAMSAIWGVRFLISEKSAIRIKKQYLKPNFKIIGSVAALGISPFIMQSTESAITIVLNSGLQTYGGDLHVGSMTILQSVMQFILIPVQGFTHGVQPIISYNYGAGKFERVKKTIKIMTIITTSSGMLFCGLIAFFPGVFARIFTAEAELIALVENVLPIFIGGMWIFGIQMSCQASFLGLGQAKKSLFIALLSFFGYMGIYWFGPIADVISATSAGMIFLFSYNKILSKDNFYYRYD